LILGEATPIIRRSSSTQQPATNHFSIDDSEEIDLLERRVTEPGVTGTQEDDDADDNYQPLNPTPASRLRALMACLNKAKQMQPPEAQPKDEENV